MSVFQIVVLNAADGNDEQIMSLLRQGREIALNMDGCEGFEIYQGQDEPNKFFMIERWASASAHQEHLQRNVMESGLMDRVMRLSAQPPEFSYYTQLSSR